MNSRNILPKGWISKRDTNRISRAKNSINDIKNAIESTGNRADHKEERITKHDFRNLEMIQTRKDN